MAETREPEIIRWETFTVISADKNNYGDLVAIDENNKEHKVKAKRDFLFNIFTPGTVVSAGIASYMNREYIAAAKISEGAPPAVKEAVKAGGVVTSVVSKDLRDLGIKRQSSLKASVDIVGRMVQAGLIKEHIQTKVLDWAEVFFAYSNQDK